MFRFPCLFPPVAPPFRRNGGNRGNLFFSHINRCSFLFLLTLIASFPSFSFSYQYTVPVSCALTGRAGGGCSGFNTSTSAVSLVGGMLTLTCYSDASGNQTDVIRVPLPAGYSYVGASGTRDSYCSSGCSEPSVSLGDSYSTNCNCVVHCKDEEGSVTGGSYATGFFIINGPDPNCNSPQNALDSAACFLPKCSTPVPVQSQACKGGQGLSFQTDKVNGEFIINGFFGSNHLDGNDFWIANPLIPQPFSDTLSRPDGSKCNLFNSGSGIIYDWTVCPLGFAETPSSSSAANSSASNSSSSAGCSVIVDGKCVDKPKEDCKVMVNGVCMDEPPSDCKVMVNGVCMEYHSSASSGGSSGSSDGTGCDNLSNCDWAKLDIQLAQLGVEIDIRNAVAAMGKDVSEGNSISREQKGVLDGVLNAIRSSNGKLDSIGGKLDGVDGKLDRMGKGIDSISSKLDCKGYDFCDGKGGGACDPRVSDCTHNFNENPSDTVWGVTRSFMDSVGRHYGIDSSGLAAKHSASRLLQDTSKVFPSMRRAISPFNDYIRSQVSGCGTVLDFSFSFGGFSCGAMCKIDLTNFGGHPIGRIMSDIMTIAFGLGVLIRLLYVVRTIGQSG
jgi:hypothetical protein